MCRNTSNIRGRIVFSGCMLVKLGRAAGGGVGSEGDIVAFSTLCTPMGGPLQGTYNGKYKAGRPVPFSFDDL